jgi:hypothetical protein
MKIRRSLFLPVLALFVLALSPISPVMAAPSLSATTISKPAFLVPLYDISGSDWSTACSALGGTASFVIADIGNPGGPGTSKSSTWTTNMNYCLNAGTSVLGYVDTAYCQASLTTVESQVDSWYTWYKANGISGIFFDEVANPPNPTATSSCSGKSSATTYYQRLATYVHQKAAQQTVVYNFGVNPVSAWSLNSSTTNANADIIVTFEDPSSDYTNYGGSGAAWKPSAWEASYPARRFSALLYDASSSTSLSPLCSAVAGQNIGYVYITPNSSYTSLPPATYFSTELRAC